MKASLILFNGLSVAAYLAWLGYHLLRSYARGFTHAAPASGSGDLVLVLAGVVTAACVAYSFFAPAGLAKAVALTPLAVCLLGYGVVVYRQAANRARVSRIEADRAAALERKLDGISKDYLLKPGAPIGFRRFSSSFLTHDRELDTIVRIDVEEEAGLHAIAVGRIRGATLETVEPVESLKRAYPHYVDAEGKSIFDRYTLRHRPDQKLLEYHLEKYEP